MNNWINHHRSDSGHRWYQRLSRQILALTTVSLFSLAGLPGVASSANAVDDLNRFFTEINSFGANFEQVVMDESSNVIEQTHGQMWIARPGKFRWDYAAPSEQRIVADGEKLWIYDVDLEQVTVRNQANTVGRTPAILLAGGGNIEDSYAIEGVGSEGQTNWVSLLPKDEDSPFERVRIGFDAKGQLVSMELVDGFGQTTLITLFEAEENADLDMQLFTFKPPSGVDVIDESNL